MRESSLKINEISEESKEAIFTQDQISSFIEKQDLIHVILRNLTNYSKVTQSTFHNFVEREDVSKHVFKGKYNHRTSINTYLDFLTFLATHSLYKIGYDELNSIC